jgi:hypothetical protein
VKVDNRLRVVRAERRISQLRLTLSCSPPIDPTRYWRIENDLVQPTALEREAIARALDVHESTVWLSVNSPAPDAIEEQQPLGRAAVRV